VTFYLYLNAFSILSFDVQQNIALLTNRIALFGSHDLIQLVYLTFLLIIFHLVCEKQQQQQQNNNIAHFHIIFTFKEFLSYFSIRNFILYSKVSD